MLVLRDTRGRVLLERRSPTGIWAGLWSLPEAQDRTEASERVAHYGKRDNQSEFITLTPFMHGFSHYHLQVTPLALRIEPELRVAENQRRWLHPIEAAALGLPAPVRKLIASLQEQT